MIHYVADFETTTRTDATRVWAYGIAEIGNERFFEWGTSLDEFMSWCYMGKNKLVYFHNLKFDAEFIIYHLLANMGFEYSDKKKSRTFNALISKQGQFYEIEVIFEKNKRNSKKVIFRDSLKKLPFPVAKIAKDFRLPILKGDIDYHKERPLGYIPDANELEYLENDVKIVAAALQIQYEQGLDRMTIGADALRGFKEVIGKKEFEYNFPVLSQDADADIRLAYYGGFTYVNSDKVLEVGEGIVFDVNSLYPSVMYNRPLPYGMPIPFDGEYEPDDKYPLYIQVVTCTFNLKPGKIPTIQDKHTGRFARTEYLKSTGTEPLTLVLTSVDLALFLEHYDVTVEAWEGGYKFLEHVGFFKDYIDYWMHVKETTSGAQRLLAKLMLNSLYGKFCTNPDVTGKYPVLISEEEKAEVFLQDEILSTIRSNGGIKSPKPGQSFYTEWHESVPTTVKRSVSRRSGLPIDEMADELNMSAADLLSRLSNPQPFNELEQQFNEYYGIEEPQENKYIRYLLKEETEMRDPVYTAMGCFITAWARDLTIRSAQAVYPRFLYADTDSIHLRGTEIPDIDVHESKLGSWKCEGTFARARFIRAKTYIEEIDGQLHVVCAGMPENVKQHVTWENFEPGLTLGGKLMPKHVEGGIVLTEVDFTIKSTAM